METEENRRVLIVDDNDSIHADFRKIIGGSTGRAAVLDSAAEALFGEASPAAVHMGFEIDSVHQGQEGLTRVQQSLEQGRRYALAFVDVRMPPGWDGIETIRRIWEVDKAIPDCHLHGLLGLLLERNGQGPRRVRSLADSQETVRQHRSATNRVGAGCQMEPGAEEPTEPCRI